MTTPTITLAPGEPVIPCFTCGTDYDLTSTLQAGRADLPPVFAGCECSHCTTSRHHVETASAAELYATFRTIALVRQGGEERTVLLCPSCYLRLRRDTPQSCTSCGTLDRSALSELTELTIDGYPTRVVRIRGLYGYGRLVADLLPHSLGPLCPECITTVISCADCDDDLLPADAYACQECETDHCCDCWESRHARHQDGAVDEGRDDFVPTISITTALRQPGTPGTIIRSTRAVGVEIESSYGEAAQVIAAHRDSGESYLASVGWDGSVTGPHPVEYRLLPLRGETLEAGLTDMNRWCRAAGYRPNESAGVHMHLDCTDLSVVKVWRAYCYLLAIEPLLRAQVATHRLDNSYCRPSHPQTYTAAYRIASGLRGDFPFDASLAGVASRYAAINPQSYAEHQTLEVRIFETDHSNRSIARYLDCAALLAAVVDLAALDLPMPIEQSVLSPTLADEIIDACVAQDLLAPEVADRLRLSLVAA